MNPNDNYTNLPSDLTDSFIKTLFNKYTEYHKDDNSINTYQFITMRLLSISGFVNKLPVVKELNKEFQSYSDSQLINVVLNSLVKKNLLHEKQAGRFYLTSTGYSLGLKKTNIFKFWSRYHPTSFYPSSLALLGIVVAILIA